MSERMRCGVCGEEWLASGQLECPFCGSTDFNPIQEESDGEDELD